VAECQTLRWFRLYSHSEERLTLPKLTTISGSRSITEWKHRRPNTFTPDPLQCGQLRASPPTVARGHRFSLRQDRFHRNERLGERRLPFCFWITRPSADSLDASRQRAQRGLSAQGENRPLRHVDVRGSPLGVIDFELILLANIVAPAIIFLCDGRKDTKRQTSQPSRVPRLLPQSIPTSRGADFMFPVTFSRAIALAGLAIAVALLALQLMRRKKQK
jgi:hypothetical protein